MKGKQLSHRNVFLPTVIFTQIFVATADYLYHLKYRKYIILIQEFMCLALIPNIFIIYHSGSFTLCRNLHCDVLNLSFILNNLYIIYF